MKQKAENMVKININYAKCVGDADKICVEICPVSIFSDKKSTKPHQHLKRKIYAQHNMLKKLC
jgi:NAD-dependent dihydropyrimidine dehydrogenase PreA subunit